MLRELWEIGALLALALLLTPVLSSAQVTQQPNKTAPKTMPQKQDQKMSQGDTNPSSQDREFILKVAEGGQMEVRMAEMGVSKATNPDVKQFTQRLVDDHTKANEELKSLASSKGISLPLEDASKSQKMKTAMEKHSGANFDRAFRKNMIKDHEKDIAMFEREVNTGKDEQVKAWADKTLPTLREHLRMAREVGGKVGVTEMKTSDDKVQKGTKGATSRSPQR